MKRGLLSIAMLLALPTFASAFNCWSVTRGVMPAERAATLVPPADAPAGQYGYKTVNNVTYVTAATGQLCSSAPSTVEFTLTPPAGQAPVVKIDGVVQSAAILSEVANTYTVSKGTKLSHSIQATYAATATQVSITTIGVAGGYISPSKKIAYGADTTVTITPAAGFTVTGVKINGVLNEAALTEIGADGGDVTLNDVTAATTVSAVFTQTPDLKASIATANATLSVGQELNFKGAAIKNMSTITPTYTWTVSPAGAAIVPNAGTTDPGDAIFTATAAGTYTVTLEVADAAKGLTDTESRTVSVITTTAAESQSCASCHAVRDAASNLTADYSASLHATNSFHLVSCADCHKPTITASHPFALSVAEASCYPCHKNYLSANHTALTWNSCAGCHDPHSLVRDAGMVVGSMDKHVNGKSLQRAQYVSGASLAVACDDCHTASAANKTIRLQYAASAHADTTGEAWIHYDWRGAPRSACARCHNGSAFVAKLGNENSLSNVFQASDVLKPGETLACSACHADAATGALRSAAQEFSITMTNNTATFNVAGASTLCARCHSGRETGASITADANTTGIRVFPDVHYKPVAGVLYNKGYDYGTNSELGAHKNLGATGQGPCVTCHMPGKNHSFAAAACSTCHDGTAVPAVDAAALKANYDTALNNLKLALETKNIYYEPAHPFYYTYVPVLGTDGQPVIGTDGQPVLKKVALTDWSKPYGAANWKQTMGAAYNYNLFWSEKGAYAHNYAYAMKLIADSIDFITDGALDPQ